MSLHDASDFSLHGGAGKGDIESFQADGGRFLVTERINLQFSAECLRHRFHAVPAHERFGVLLFLSVFRGSFGLGGTPAAVSIIAAIVSIPAEHVPKFRPIEQRAASENARGQLPRPGATRSVELLLAQHIEMRQQNFHACDSLACGSDMSSLPTVAASRAGETVIGTKRHHAATEQVDRAGLISDGLQHGPAEGTMAYVKGELEVGARCRGFAGWCFLLGAHVSVW